MTAVEASGVKFGVTPVQTGVSFEHIRAIAVHAEELGFESIWLNDHFFTSPYFYPLPPPSAPYYECWVTLSALAALTRRIRIGTLCTNASFRNPALLAKMASCVDVISGGRLELSLGAGWFREEHTAYGIPFPKIAERAERLKDAVQIIRRLWTEDRVTFKGRYYTVEGAYCSPKPIQEPHPPLGIGARGSRLMLRVVAELADHWNLQTPITPAQYRRKAQTLERYCREIGRDPTQIRRSLWAGAVIGEDAQDFSRIVSRLNPPNPFYLESRIAGNPERCIETVRRFAELGVDLFILYFPVEEARSLETFARLVLPAFR